VVGGGRGGGTGLEGGVVVGSLVVKSHDRLGLMWCWAQLRLNRKAEVRTCECQSLGILVV
jgi:hypothetical protein